ncbi:MAG: formylglycine-generating enzyme family protein [Deltaproteobacteria bacterium]|jgi:formylglycine-generating enzyme required for sulfatase activity|nr:formylglycine-generating enzyme family protein [Deltaproteobacteria bacterium]
MTKITAFFTALVLFAILTLPNLALALPDAEVQALAKKSQTFKRAEDRILSVWKNLPADFKKSIQAEQIDWIKYRRDMEADKLISQGLSKADAYAQVTHARSDYLLLKSAEYSRGSSSSQSPTTANQGAQSDSSGSSSSQSPTTANKGAQRGSSGSSSSASLNKDNLVEKLSRAKSSSSASQTKGNQVDYQDKTKVLGLDYAFNMGMSFEYIEAGTFIMGMNSDHDYATETDSQPEHEVTISAPFYLGETEVTQAQWEAVMGSNPTPAENIGANKPVTNFTWDEVQTFIQKLNQMAGTDKFRLPTEAEWEYAARAGTQTPWFFGENADYLDDYAWYAGNADEPQPVGLLRPNPWGLYDIIGNVRELTADYYHSDYYKVSPAKDPKGPLVGDDQESRSARGGTWYNSPERCHAAYRFFLDKNPSDGDIYTGVRLVYQ